MRSFKGGEHYVEIVHVDEWSGKKMSLSLSSCVLAEKRALALVLTTSKTPLYILPKYLYTY